MTYYTQTTRRLSMLAVVSWSTFAGILAHSCLSTARGDVLAPAPPDPQLLTWLLGQMSGGHIGTGLVIGTVFLVVKALRAHGGERWPVLRSPAGGAILGALVSVLGALVSMGVSGSGLSWDVVTMVLVAWWGAAGSQSTLKDIVSLDFTPKAPPAAPVVGSPL